jgi:7,8-dihydropterin-6-yl-methyl-4-(beta-D-ribofuranosyl)aminobenzene 5'-phosphate synthase
MKPYPSRRSISALTLLLIAPLGVSSAVRASASDDRGDGDGGTAPTERITVLYDAFGTSLAMKKDWGFAALVEIGGRRILFDTGNNPRIFAQNVKTAGVDLGKLDFVIMSHRHGDHMGGMTYLLDKNPNVKIYAPQEAFGVYGASLPGSFYRKDESLPQEMRYFDGKPPEVLRFGAAWPRANIALIDKTTEVAPGVTLIAQVSDAPGTKELRELSLAINTPHGVVLIVGCSHPGIEAIVAEAATINPRIRVLAGGFHLVAADDSVIEKIVAALHDTYRVERIAPGHCSGEHTFSAVKHVFGDKYQYAGVGTVVRLGVDDTARGR